MTFEFYSDFLNPRLSISSTIDKGTLTMVFTKPFTKALREKIISSRRFFTSFKTYKKRPYEDLNPGSKMFAVRAISMAPAPAPADAYG